MKINIGIDDTLMSAALEASGYRNKEEAVEEGLKLLARRGQQQDIRGLRGKIPGEGDLDEMRDGN